MRSIFLASVLIAIAVGAPQARAQGNLQQGCALPHVAQLVRQIFGPYAVAFHNSGTLPSEQSQTGNMRIMGQGMVVCRFARTTDPGTDGIYIVLHSYTNEDDASTGFTNNMPLYTTRKHVGSVQFNERPGGVEAYRFTSLVEVKWTGAGTMRDNPSIDPSRLEPIAMVLVCPGAKMSC